MLLHGAIIPPRAVLEAVADVVKSVRPPGAEAASASPRRGFLGRIAGRQTEAEQPIVAPDLVEHVPIERMYLPIAGFGNVTPHDARRLTDAIAEAASTWIPATVHFAGGTALDFPGDPCVWAKLDGDVDSLLTIARGVNRSVERLGFFTDRRMFRPMLSLATVTEATTGPYLQDVVDALDGFRGSEWTVDFVSMMKLSYGDKHPETKEFERIQLAPQ